MSFTGQIAQVPIGISGQTGTKNQTQVLPSHLITTDNITYENGTLQKEGGASKINSTALSTDVIAGWDWHPVIGDQRQIVVTDDGKVYREPDNGIYAEIATGLTVTGITPVFVEGGAEVAANDKKLFLLSGSNSVKVLSGDGTSLSNISNPPADWSGSDHPTAGVIHENRFWAFGNASDPHRVYASLATDHEDFTTTPLQFSVFPGEGERIIAGASFKGLLILAKFPRGLYIINTTDPDTTNWKISKHSENIGMASPLAWVAIDDDILFMDSSGSFQILSTITEFGNLGNRNLSQTVDWDAFMRTNINKGQLDKVQAVYYVEKNLAMFAVAEAGQTLNSSIIGIDFNIPDQPRFRFSTRDDPTALWLRRDGDDIYRPAIGDPDGFTWDLDTLVRSKDGSGYIGSFRTPNDDLSELAPELGTKRKNFHFLELVVEPEGNWDLTVEVYIDDALSQIVTFNMGIDAGTLGSFVLGTDALGGDTLISRKRRINGSTN